MMKVFQLSMALVFLLSLNAFSQFKTPRPSPDATVSQYVGITEITIDYSSPGVKGRTIWGELVPYGKIWRTGANEVTSITFSDPVKINGIDLEAGTYGIHTIPGENEWEFIFSKDTKVDDPMNYDKSKDALKLKIKPESAPFTERMIFTITDMTNNSAKVNLIWDKLKVSFDVEVATQELVLQSARESADWGTLNNAANYCLQQNVNIDEGYKWIQASTLIEENYWNLRVLAQYLAKMDMKNEAISKMEKAIELGNKMDNPPFDFDNMKKMLEDWKK
jgi:putative hemolysin